MTLFGVQHIARSGINAHQRALGVAGNNISNVDTPGFTRRRAVFESQVTQGVRMLGAERLRDQFLDLRLRDSNARFGARQTLSTNLQMLEAALNESENSGTSVALQEFFASVQDLVNQPSGSVERLSLFSRGESLAASLKSAAGEIQQIRTQIDQQVRQQIEQVNQITQSIAELNGQILNRFGTEAPNHLLDQRDQLINELSTILPLNVIAGSNNTVTVLAEGGLTLVESGNAYALRTIDDSSNNGFAAIGFEGITGETVNLQRRVDEGSLSALLQSRDQEALEVLNRIQRMTAELVRSFNAVHRQGTGLDGSTGLDFFAGLSVDARAGLSNSGGGVIGSGSIVDESLLTFDDYEIRFTAPGTFDVVNVTQGAVVSSGNAYTPGANITFDGISVSISDGASAPAAGDVFRVNSYANTIENFGLSSDMSDNPDRIAAGLTSDPGDNRNAIQLSALQSAGVLGQSGSLTFEQFFSEARARLGLRVQSSLSELADEEVSQLQVQQMIDSISSVSIDEESIDLVQFQRAFEASSRIISITDEMLATLINTV